MYIYIYDMQFFLCIFFVHIWGAWLKRDNVDMFRIVWGPYIYILMFLKQFRTYQHVLTMNMSRLCRA